MPPKWFSREPENKKPNEYGICPVCHKETNFIYIGSMKFNDSDIPEVKLYNCQNCHEGISQKRIIKLIPLHNKKLEVLAN